MSSLFASSPVWSGMMKPKSTFHNILCQELQHLTIFSVRSCKKEETAEMRVLAADTLAYLIEVNMASYIEISASIVVQDQVRAKA